MSRITKTVTVLIALVLVGCIGGAIGYSMKVVEKVPEDPRPKDVATLLSDLSNSVKAVKAAVEKEESNALAKTEEATKLREGFAKIISPENSEEVAGLRSELASAKAVLSYFEQREKLLVVLANAQTQVINGIDVDGNRALYAKTQKEFEALVAKYIEATTKEETPKVKESSTPPSVEAKPATAETV